jgi:hypothetical protein
VPFNLQFAETTIRLLESLLTPVATPANVVWSLVSLLQRLGH